MELKKYRLNFFAWVVLAGVLLLRIGTSMTVPFIAIYLHFKAGVSLPVTGMIIGISYLSYSLGGFWGGFLSDRYGRQKILEISLFCYGIVFYGFGLSTGNPAIEQTSLVFVFLLLNMSAGFFRIWSDTLTQAILGDVVTSAEERITAFNFYYMFVNIGAAIGPVLGTWIGTSGTNVGFYYTGGLCWLYLLLFIFFASKAAPGLPSGINNGSRHISLKLAFSTIISDKVLRFYILGGIIAYFSYVQQEAILGTILMQRFGDTHIFAMILFVNAVVAILLQMPLVGYLLKKHVPLVIMRNGCIFFVAGLLGMAFAGSSLPTYIISQIIFTVGEILVLSISGIFIDSIAPKDLKGAYFGAMSFCNLGKCAGPVVGGSLLQDFDGGLVLAFFGVFSLLAMIFYHKSLLFYEERGLCRRGEISSENAAGL